MPNVLDDPLHHPAPEGAQAAVIRLPAALASDRVAARADEQAGFQAALRTGLAAICEELELIGARAWTEAPPGRAVWHVARPADLRTLVAHVLAGTPVDGSGLDSNRVQLFASGRTLAFIEAFAEPQRGRLRELEAVCRKLTDVLARKPSDDDEHRYRRLFEEGPLPGWVLDPGGAVLAMNQAACRETGYGAEELAGRRLREALQAVDHGGMLRCTRKDGTPLELALHEREISFQGRPALLAFGSVPSGDGLATDRDPLTGLASRNAFLQRLQEAFDRTRAKPGAAIALLFLDVDRFRRVNNSVGSTAGDALLAQMADRIRAAIPPRALAARLGADEFTVLLENVRDPGQALRTAERLHVVLQQPFKLEQIEVVTTVSMGIAFSGRACATPHELLRDADTAMARARSRGPGRTVVWDSTMASPSAARLQMEAELRRALDKGELEVAYQPIVALQTGEITGFEALARWNHPVRGAVPPATFVPVAEEAGLVERMSHAILRDACHHMRTLEIGMRAPLSLSVNLSARQLLRPDLADEIAAVIAAAGMEASRLHVEVTESLVVENREVAAALLRRLRDLRVKVFLDDFGTGYSSLSYLHDLPVDGLKIDRSFVEALRSGQRASALVGSILTLAGNLGLEVIAEGIETEAQAQALRDLHCASAQGYLFAYPAPAEQARALLRKGPFFWR